MDYLVIFMDWFDMSLYNIGPMTCALQEVVLEARHRFCIRHMQKGIWGNLGILV